MNYLPIIFAFFLFLLFDIIFLYINGKSFQLQIIDVQRVSLQMNYIGALGAYILLFFGLYWFILKNRRPILDAVLLGGIINGTYEFTNYATFKKWHIETVIKDIVWGGTLWGLVTLITYKVFPSFD